MDYGIFVHALLKTPADFVSSVPRDAFVLKYVTGNEPEKFRDFRETGPGTF